MSPINPSQNTQPSLASYLPRLASSFSSTQARTDDSSESMVQIGNGLMNNLVIGTNNTANNHIYLAASDSKLLETLMLQHIFALQPNTVSLANLNLTIEKLRTEYLRGLQEDNEIKDALSNYVAPEGMGLHDSTRFDLKSKAQDFLNSDKKVLLLLGEAGSGKSTFNRDLAVSLWEAYLQGGKSKNMPIPVFIGLSSLSGPDRNLVNAFFEKQGFSKEQIKELQSKHRFVLILDGFDEIEHRQQVFYKDNELANWKDTKIIISSRPEYLGPNYQYKFHPSGERSALQEYRLAPFSDETIKRYIDRYSETHPHAVWSAERYKGALDEPSLKELVSNPFLLKITLSVLPELSQRGQAENQRLTRIAIYDQFVKSWFDRSQRRLNQILEVGLEERKEFKKLERGGFADFGAEFSQELALAMYQAGEVITHYQFVAYAKWKKNNLVTEGDWRRRLLGDEDISTVLMRLNAPLICQDKQDGSGKEYRFIHKSVRDYLVARMLWEELGAHDKTALSSWLNTLNIVNDPAILQFLVERVRQEPKLENQLLRVVEQSKGQEGGQFERGAANAITVLVKAGVIFNRTDLQGIRIPGADLSYGIFDLAHLQGADLTRVKLQGAWLRGVNFDEAEMAEVEFGERVCLEMSGSVNTCCYSPDGLWLAVGAGNHIYLYESNRLHLISTTDQDGHQDDVLSITISSDGKWLVSGSGDKTVKLWYLEGGALCLADTGIGHEGMVRGIAMPSDGKWLASAGDDKTVRLWRIEENKLCLLDTNITSERSLSCVAISPNDQWLAASGGEDKKLMLWRIEESKLNLLNRHETRQDSPASVAFSLDSRWLASGHSDGKVELWSIDEEEFSLVHTYAGHQNVVSSIAFSPDGEWLASGSFDRKVKVWHLKGERTLLQVYQGHEQIVSSVAFSPDNGRLASGGMDRTVKFWTIGEGDRLSNTNENHEGNVSDIVCSSDGGLLISGNQDGNIKVRCVKEGQYSLIGTFKNIDWIVRVAMSLDGKWLVLGGTQAMTLWRIEEGKLCLADTYIGHVCDVWSVAISSNAKWIASGSWDKTVKLWHIEKGKFSLADIGNEHQGKVKSVAISLDGKFLASGSEDKTVKLWRIEEGRLNLVNTSIEHQDIVNSVALSPNGEWLTSGSRDRTVKLWSTSTGKLVHTYTGHQNSVNSVKVSPDGKWIASIGWERTVKIWSLTEPSRCYATLEGWSADILALAWQTSSENSIRLALAGVSSIYSLQLDRNEEGWENRLQWISHQSALSAFGAKIDKGLNLSEMNAQFLIQKGANQVFIQELENQMHQRQKRVQEIIDANSISIPPPSDDSVQNTVNHTKTCMDLMNIYLEKMNLCLEGFQEIKYLRGSEYNSFRADWMNQFELGLKKFDEAADLLTRLKSILAKEGILLPEKAEPALMEA